MGRGDPAFIRLSVSITNAAIRTCLRMQLTVTYRFMKLCHSKRPGACAGLLILLFSAASPLWAIQIVGYDTLTNDRFANDGSFVADQFDMSGVAHNGRWATMISENVYVTAEHFAPGVGSSMTFYADNDPNGTSVTRSITSNRQQIQDTDIFVGTLDSALPAGFSFFDFATEAITNTNSGPPGARPDSGSFVNSPYFEANAYAVGRSPSSFEASQNMAVGRNLLDDFVLNRNVTGANSGDAIEATDDGSGGVVFEAMLETGDSGAPLFVDNGSGSLTIVGVNWFVASTSTEDFFGASYLGNYDDDIQAFVDANAVPEPATYALLIGILALGSTVLRRGRGPTVRA